MLHCLKGESDFKLLDNAAFYFIPYWLYTVSSGSDNQKSNRFMCLPLRMVCPGAFCKTVYQ